MMLAHNVFLFKENTMQAVLRNLLPRTQGRCELAHSLTKDSPLGRVEKESLTG